MRLPVFIFIVVLSALIFSPLSHIFAVESTESATTPNFGQIKVGDKTASKSGMLKDRLQAFQDKKKAALVQLVSDLLEKINAQRTKMMMQHLTTMSNIVSKLESRVAQVATEGKDTTAATSSISDAKVKIQAAKVAVTSQQGKEYVIEASSEAKIKDEVMTVRKSLHTDLKAVHMLVVDARKSVADAIETAAKTLGGVGNGQ